MSHLTLAQRYEIGTLKSQGFLQTQIADIIGKNKSVVCRELKRNSDQRSGVYKAELAQKKTIARHAFKPKKVSFTKEIENRVIKYLKMDYSPEQIVGASKNEGLDCVSTERIYQFIWKSKREGKFYHKHLRTKGKRYKKRGHLKDCRGLIVGRVDINQRPSIVEKKERIGDLEIDLVIGKEHKGALLTINDRATGVLKMGKVESKEAEAIERKTIELLENWKPFLHTITSDNGKEFAFHQNVAEALEIDFYFAKPYHSWQRGANENLNGLIRQYFPKRMDFSSITEEQINQVVNILNNRPRKRYDYKSPNQMFSAKLDSTSLVAFIT